LKNYQEELQKIMVDNNSNKKIKVAIVGCGRISSNHIKALINENKRAELVAICEPSEERIQNTLNLIKQESVEIKIKFTKPRIFRNFEQLIKEKLNKIISIDLVVLTTPSGLHPIQTEMAAKSGINVCTEKPMAVSWLDGVNMLKTCREHNVRLFVVKQNRLNQTIQLLRKQIEKGRFGKIALVTINVFWQRPQSYYDQDDWRGTKDLDGGALMNQASHYVDLIDWLIGPVKFISAFTSTISRSIEAEDTAVMNMEWENGALGTMAVTMLTYPNNLEGSITVLGEKGSVKIGGKAINNIDFWKFSKPSKDDELIDKASYETNSVYGFGHKHYWSNMLDSLLNNSTSICDGEDGIKSLELLIAAYKSSNEKRIIDLPLPR
tara:strand:+ start:79 stop:1215 length:1137 start_codon:yes stop_codon:yes gene_type:complete